MSDRDLLLRILGEGYERKAWHGPNLRGTLRGLNANQAVGGAGALLGLAQQHLAKNDWSKLAKVIPGASSLISQAKALGGIKKFESLAALAPAFTKIGLTSDQVKAIQGSMSDAITKSGGADLAAKFNAAIK